MQKKKTVELTKAFSFKMSCLFNTEKDKSLKYRLELLQKEDKNYMFLLHLVTSASSEVYKKSIYVFRVQQAHQFKKC